MKILYLLFAVFLLLFQATSGSADPIHLDTLQCRGPGKFCLDKDCPPPFAATSTCQGGTLNCCTKILAE